MRSLVVIIAIAAMIVLAGCGGVVSTVSQPAELYQPETVTHSELLSLPEPKEPIVVGVYKFEDETGQYKPAPTQATTTSFSRAITQGATSILVEALQNSGWFWIVEREGLTNLTEERKIIRSTRMEHGDQTPVPPMLYAGVILEGGVISYDTDVVTGGFGLKYFGTGGSMQVRKDQVTVYVRAVSVKNGRVLKSVSTTKTIYSKMVDLGTYKFVKPKRLLEMETGYSKNEPTHLCLTDAIDKAVVALVVEGILDGLWELKNPEDMKVSVIQEYLEERNQSPPVSLTGSQGQ